MAKKKKQTEPKTKKTKTKKTSAQKKQSKIVKNRSKSTKKNKTSLSLFSNLIKWAVIAGIWGIIILSIIIAWYGSELPKITQQANFKTKHNIEILFADGSILSRRGDQRGNPITISSLPSYVPQAIIAIEDRRFYSHIGVDILGISRAMLRNIVSGSVRQGGSTLTQQLAKNLFLSADRTLKRKIQEALLAIWLENALSKEEILEAYMNRVYLGGGAYGINAASNLYFNKNAQELSISEAAMIAGLLKAPSRYNPLSNPSGAKKRQKTVLQAMQRSNFITKEQATHAANININAQKNQRGLKNKNGYAIDYIMNEAGSIIGQINSNLIIETTINPIIQQSAIQNIETRLQNTDKSITQGAAFFMQHDGSIISIVGGVSYSQSQFNRATQALRQPGSAFKPIIALTALENGWKEKAPILDAPFEENQPYRPENFAHKYDGDISLQHALTYSKNTAFVRLMQKSGGPRATIQTARKLDITSPLEPDLSLALGSSALTLSELTNAYRIIANDGYKNEPYTITKILSQNGEIIYEYKNKKPIKTNINSRSINMLQDMLRNVVSEGTAKNAKSSLSTNYGKTGTSQDYRDAWFIGYNDKLIGGIWLGNDDNSSMDKVTGGSLPAILWREISDSTYSKLQSRKANENDNTFLRLLNSLQTQPEDTKRTPLND